MGEIREKCAVVGVFDPNAAELASLALRVLDHRGPDSTGVGGMTSSSNFEVFHAPGRARDVLTDERIDQLGELGLVAASGHGRYATSGGAGKSQPIQAGSIQYAENGTRSMLAQLEKDLAKRHIDTRDMNDSEMSAWSIGDRVAQGAGLVDAIADAYPLMVGGQACVVTGEGECGEPMMAAWRDKQGIRPLVLGRTVSGGWMVASETEGLDAAGATFVEDVEPGTLLTFNEYGMKRYELAKCDPKYDPFELIYFSNKNSLFMGNRIGDIRAALGRMLAAEYGSHDHGTATVSIPNSANTYTEGYSEALGIPYLRKAIHKTTIERTFLQATAEMRSTMRQKIYEFDQLRFRGHDLDVIDDSLVRNNTAPHANTELMKAGARSVNILIASPPIRFPNYCGINLPEQKDLVAATMSMAEIKQAIGCKRLGYLSLEGMLDTLTELTGVPADHFDLSAFTGEYPVPIGNRDIQMLGRTEYAA